MLAAESGRSADLRSALRLETVTIAWMAVEVVVALGAGIMARSVLLTSFGLDSIVELISAWVLTWRLRLEHEGGSVDRVARAERLAGRVTGILLVLLCVYIVASSGIGLLLGSRPRASLPGIGLAVVAVLLMPYLAARKRRLAESLSSPALRGDAACSTTCFYLAFLVLLGLLLNAFLGWWWADYVGALGLLYWIGREAREVVRASG